MFAYHLRIIGIKIESKNDNEQMFANIILYFLSYYIFILQNFTWFKHININTLRDVKTYKYCIKLIYEHKWHSTLIAYISK